MAKKRVIPVVACQMIGAKAALKPVPPLTPIDAPGRLTQPPVEMIMPPGKGHTPRDQTRLHHDIVTSPQAERGTETGAGADGAGIDQLYRAIAFGLHPRSHPGNHPGVGGKQGRVALVQQQRRALRGGHRAVVGHVMQRPALGAGHQRSPL